MVRTSYNPFILENDDFKMIIQPGEYKKWNQERQSDVAFSVKDKSGIYIHLTDSQIETIWELMDLFWFKVDNIERVWNSKIHTRILLKPEDQIEVLDDPNYQPPKKDKQPPVIIEKQVNSSNIKDTIKESMNSIFADIESWKITGTPIGDVVYNWDPEKYLRFRAWLAASVKHVLQKNIS